MQKPEVYWLNNPFDLSDVTHYPIEDDLTIRQWLDGNGGIDRLNQMPTVCVYQGKELLRAEYNQVIDGPVCFVTLPQGGDSGSNPLMIVAMIALTVFTMGTGTLALGGLMASAGITSTNMVLVAQCAVMLAGSMLINAVFPPPGLPASAAPSQGSPTYSVGAQGNAARLGAPIPVNYGRMRIYPDFAAQPYAEYTDNEQYLYQLFCIGQGRHIVHDIRLEDTPLGNYEDVATEIIPPLGRVTLFHTAVVVAPEAGGQDLSEPVILGPYVINDVGTEISRISVDLVFPGGLIGVDEDDGDEYGVGVELYVEAQAIDDDGRVSDRVIDLFFGTIADCTRTAIRRTLGADVPPGRYQVTIGRTTAKGGKSEVRNCQLGSVKGYLVDDNEYGDLTLLAVRILATGRLSDASSRLVNCIVEREIPVWDPGDGWSLPRFTANPAWCFADAARSRYGGDFKDSEIDLRGLHYLAALFDDRGDEFNGRFDTEQSLWDGLGKIGQVCRSAPIRQGNLLRMVRDQHQPAPVAQFSMANMTDFSLDFVMHNDRTADSVKVTYWDKDRDYAQTTILCQLPDETADNPKEVTLFGCTGYEQAWREGMYLAASNRDRRQLASWKTEMEGYIPTFGDVVWVNHDLLGAGQVFSGVVEQRVGEALLLSRAIEMPGDNWYLVLRDRQGKPSLPVRVAQSGENVVRLLDTLPFEPEDDPYRERTHFMIGRGKQYAWPVKVTAVTPEADDRITIAGCLESGFVHSADHGKIPPPPPDMVPLPQGLVIEGLISTQGGTVQDPVILLGWKLARGADRYLIEISRDGRKTWQPAGTGLSFVPQHEFSTPPGAITCRVAAVAAIRGDWAMVEVNAGGEFDKPGKLSLQLAEPFTGSTLKVRWAKEPAAARYLVEVLYKGIRARALYVDRQTLEYSYHWQDAQQDGAGRELTVRARAQNAENVNGDWGEVTATNPPPGIPDNVVIDGLIDAFTVRADRPDDTDIREFRCYGSQTRGFKPAMANLLAVSQTPWINLSLKGTWHFKVAWVDQWGADNLNFSGEIQAESGAVDTDAIQAGIDGIDDSLKKVTGDVVDIRGDLDELEQGTAGHLESLRKDLGGLGADIRTEESRRVAADQTLAEQVQVLSAGFEEGDRKLLSGIKVISTAQGTADETHAEWSRLIVSDYQAADRSLTGWVNTEVKTLSDRDKALGQRIDTVEATANGNRSAVQVNSKAVAEVKDGMTVLEARWGVTLDVDGYCSGFALNNDGKQSEALFRADLFAVGSPGVDSFSFVIDGNTVAIPGNLVAGGTITGDKIQANAIEAGHLKANSVTAGKIAAQAVTAQNLAADVASFISANIEEGSITSAKIRDGAILNAKIGNIIQSNNYQAGDYGWKIDKSGAIEANDATIRGILLSSTIKGSVIESSIFIEGDNDPTVTTEADTGRMPRFVKFKDKKNYSIGIDEDFKWTYEHDGRMATIRKRVRVIPVAAGYTGQGVDAGGHYYLNFDRFRYHKACIELSCEGETGFNQAPYIIDADWDWYDKWPMRLDVRVSPIGTASVDLTRSRWVSNDITVEHFSRNNMKCVFQYGHSKCIQGTAVAYKLDIYITEDYRSNKNLEYDIEINFCRMTTRRGGYGGYFRSYTMEARTEKRV